MSDDTALTAALIDIEHFVQHDGWDQPVRLFALVETDALIAADPDSAKRLGLQGSADGAPEGALTSIEQDGFNTGEDLGDALAHIMWPDSVAGCAIVVERAFMPAEAEAELPEDADAAAQAVVHDPRHDELRVVAGALRAPSVQHAIARIRSSNELLGSPTLAPNLTAALADTLVPAGQESL